MFQTSHEYSSYHGAARCISGGPIYITDTPGAHDIELIKQMTAQSIQKKTIILRPATLGKTIASGIYTGFHEERILKIGTLHTFSGGKTSILGLFNVSSKPLVELVMLDDFPGVNQDFDYVVRVHNTGELTKPLKVGHGLSYVSMQLASKGWNILTAYPLHNVKGISVAAIGLLGKITAVAAVIGFEVNVDLNSRVRLRTSLKALGVLGERRVTMKHT
jgi:hypothetical protein